MAELSAEDWFALISIGIWLFACSFQVWENYSNKSVEGLSKKFVFQWILGDATSIVALFFLNSLLFQKALAIYYLFMDLIMFGQIIYYESNDDKPKVTQGDVQRLTGPRWVLVLEVLTWFIPFTAGAPLEAQEDIPRVLSQPVSNWKEIIGLLCGWLSVLYYFSSRFPQIFENAKNKSTKGVSKLMFIFCFLGELTYLLSVLTSQQRLRANGKIDMLYYKRQSAFIISAIGSMGSDLAVVFQFYYYDYQKPTRGSNQSYFSYMYYTIVGEPHCSILVKPSTLSDTEINGPVEVIIDESTSLLAK